MNNICRICQKEPISDSEIKHSRKEFQISMCYDCQKKARATQNYINAKHPNVASNQQVLISLSLNHRGIKNELEYSDGYKRVDIAILDPKIYIEVNGKQHINDAIRLISDIKRTYYSFKDGFLTLHIYNDAINEESLNKIINAIREIIDDMYASSREQAIKTKSRIKQDNCD
jgi:very-short-patch-repair endonuclease